MPTASCRAAASRPTVSSWIAHVDPTSFCRSGCCPASFRRLFLEKLGRCPRRRTSALLRRPCRAWPNRTPSRLISAPLRRAEWVVFSKRPFGGPEKAAFSPLYLCPATRIGSPFLTAGSSRLRRQACHLRSGRDYRAKGAVRYKVMTVDADEFIRRFLIHVLLPMASIASRHYGLFARMATVPTTSRAPVGCSVRQSPPPLCDEGDSADGGKEDGEWKACPCCGGRMVVIRRQLRTRLRQPRKWPASNRSE